MWLKKVLLIFAPVCNYHHWLHIRMLPASSKDLIARVKLWGNVWGVWRGQNAQKTFPKLPEKSKQE